MDPPAPAGSIPPTGAPVARSETKNASSPPHPKSYKITRRPTIHEATNMYNKKDIEATYSFYTTVYMGLDMMSDAFCQAGSTSSWGHGRIFASALTGQTVSGNRTHSERLWSVMHSSLSPRKPLGCFTWTDDPLCRDQGRLGNDAPRGNSAALSSSRCSRLFTLS